MNKKIILLSLLFLALIIMPITFASENATDMHEDVISTGNEDNDYNDVIYVATDGNDNNIGSDEKSVKTINKAIELACKNETSSHKIIVKEGNYTESELEITSRLEITAQGNVTINGNRNMILEISTPEEVKISGIRFTNGFGGAIYIEDAKVTIDNCIFTNNTSDYGAAIYWNADDGILSNSYFTYNRARIGSAVLWGTNDEDDSKERGKRGLIINTTFENNDNANSYPSGGCMGLAIYADSVNVTNCKFINSIGRFDTIGGSLLIQGKYVTVDSCLFKNNTMNQAPAIQVHGDWATIINCNFTENIINNQGRGGALDIQSNNIKVCNNTFTNNGGDECYNGGAITIYTFEDGIKNITNNRFINNSASYGGAIFINGGATSYVYDELIIVNNNVFDGNTAITAAGIYIMNVTIDQSLVVLKNNRFMNLEAQYSSAIHISSAEVEILNNTITNCISFDGNNHIFNNDGYIDGILSLRVGDEDVYGLYAGKTIKINATVKDDMNNSISGGIIYFMVNGENIDDDGFSLESGVATVPFYSSIDGLYTISADYYNGEVKSIKNCTVVAVPYIITINFNETQGVCGESITVPVEVSVIILDTEYIADDENLTISFNDEKFNVNLIDGSCNIPLKLPETNGTYRLDVTYDIKTVSKYITVKNNTVSLIIPQSKFTPDSTVLNIILKDPFNNTLGDQNITLKYNKTEKIVKTDSNGVASVDLNLDVGEYDLTVIYSNPKYKLAEINETLIVDYLDTVLTGLDVEMKYNDGSTYVLRLTNSVNQPLTNQSIIININGESKTFKTDANGIVTMLIDLTPGTYVLTANYNGNEVYRKSSISNRITVNSKAKLVGSDVTMYFTDKAYYKVRLYDDNGKAVGSGESVKITVNGKSKNVKTDKNGYASFKIGLKPKTYTITASYGHLKTTNKIVVKQILTAKNISKKKSKVVKFKAKLAKKKPIKGKKITFKINGKTYKVKTNKKGVATLKLKNLKVGKYKIVTSYSTLKIKNTIKIKK